MVPPEHRVAHRAPDQVQRLAGRDRALLEHDRERIDAPLDRRISMRGFPAAGGTGEAGSLPTRTLLAGAVRRYFSDGELRDRLRGAAAASVERYAPEAVFGELEAKLPELERIRLDADAVEKPGALRFAHSVAVIVRSDLGFEWVLFAILAAVPTLAAVFFACASAASARRASRAIRARVSRQPAEGSAVLVRRASLKARRSSGVRAKKAGKEMATTSVVGASGR